MGFDRSPFTHHIGGSGKTVQAKPVLLAVSAREVEGRVVVTVGGELDIATVPTLAALLDEVIESSTCPIELDLDGVRFLGAAAVRVLQVGARRCAHAGRTLSLRNTNEQMRHVLSVHARHAREPYGLRW